MKTTSTPSTPNATHSPPLVLIVKKELAQEVKNRLAERQRAKTDLMFLANDVLGYTFQEDVHRDLFNSLLNVKEGVPLADQDSRKDRLILWPRGHYKSTALVVQAIQLVLNFPDIRILLLGATAKNGRGFLREIRSHFDGSNPRSHLLEVFPELKAAGKKYGNSDSFTVPTRQRVSKEPTFLVVSQRTAKAGLHAEILLCDDVQNDVNWRSPELIEKLVEDFNLAQALLDPGVSYRFVVGTRYCFGDLYETILKQAAGSWFLSHRNCWKDPVQKVPLFSQRRLEDGRTIGFTKELLEQIERNDPRVFASQYLNQPIADRDQLFSEELLLGAVKATPDLPALGHKFFFVDLAASRQSAADHSVIMVAQADGFGRIYITDCRGDHYAPVQLANNIIEMALKHRPIRIFIEGTASATYFIEFLRTMAREKGVVLPLETIKVDNRKDAKFVRISAVEGFLRNQRLFFVAGLPHWQDLVEEAVQFPKSRHDDYLDTISLACAWFANNTSQRVVPQNQPNPLLDAILNKEPVKLPFEPSPQPTGLGSLGSDFACD